MDYFVNKRRRVRVIAMSDGPNRDTIYCASEEFLSKSSDHSLAEIKQFNDARLLLAKQLEAEGWAWIGEHKYDWRFRRPV